MLPSQLGGQLDAMDGGRKARNEQAPLGAGKDLLKLPPYGSFARRVAGALYVGGVLEQCQDPPSLAVFRKGVQVEQAVVGGSRVDLEVAGVHDHPERRVDGERDAIDQA